jgi:DNA-directed RNA polymerase alpha subunit
MTKKKDAQQFPDKDLKKLPDAFVDSVAAMKEDELKKIVYECEGNIYTIEQSKAQDEKLQSARESVKEWAAPYREASSIQKAKIKYIMWLLEGRGVDLDHTENTA